MSQNPSPKLDTNGNGEQAGPPDPALQARLQLICRPFTRRELSDLTGISHESVRRYLGGQNPGVLFVMRLCEALNISADWLLLGRGMPLFLSDQRKDPSHESINRALETLGEHFRLLSEEISRAATVRPTEFASPESVTHESEPDPSNTPIKRGKRAPPVQVRLLLGPANGRNLELRQPLPNRILVVLGEAGAVTAEPSEREAAPGEMVYRRVLDRSYRWVPSDR
ncbi:MAG: helix-turn-helix transcriptional regulator [Phycisphaeraceae bacterium]|nr:helix-turn-helix transcriptional regulator [Phycisphaeraceae bacterium]